MFTGLVEEIGIIRRVQRQAEGALLVIGADKVLANTAVGDSIAVSGACLTVTDLSAGGFVAECMAETLLRTTIGRLSSGDEVNLERALTLGSRLGGHMVLGHVDGVGEVRGVERRGDALEVSISLPLEAEAFVATKGSVAIDGVSLTIIRVGADAFAVGLIPHTMESTTLRSLASGTLVNIEVDVIARYVHRCMETAGVAAGTGASQGVSMELLVEKGFV